MHGKIIPPLIVAGVKLLTDAGPHTMSGALYEYNINPATPTAYTINLPPGAAGLAGTHFVVKDGSGAAATYNITVAANGFDLIDGAATYVIASNYGSLHVVWNGTAWDILSQPQPSSSSANTVNAGSSGNAGTVQIFPATASDGKTTITASNNSGNTTTNINTAAQSGARTYTIPDAGGNADFLLVGQTQGSNRLLPTRWALPISATRTAATNRFAGKRRLRLCDHARNFGWAHRRNVEQQHQDR